ncbi:MAG: single-stranded-DNA-specific exonuclease RecJ [Deltaproteobacteria bacterium]|nr:single-stranded-DNA-specific exonuclease RecJ [Deltaproteobacteria bacterium]
MRWVPGEATSPEAESSAGALALQLGLRAAVGRALWARKIRDVETARRFLDPQLGHLPDPFGLKGIEAAVGRIQRALEQREAITIYGDYDVDGVTSTTLLVSTLRRLAACAPGVDERVSKEALLMPSGLAHTQLTTQAQGRAQPARIDFYVPHRLVEGYGLNLEAMQKLAARGTRLVVSADCGVTAVAEIDGAARLGLDVVVIDHHTAAQRSEDLPRAVAILNPHQPGCEFPGRELAAVGVAFHLLLALRKRLRESGWFANRQEPNLREALDLVALGTIADVVPLTGPNRVLVRHGLKELERAARPGVLALKSVAQLAGAVTAGDVGFKLGPRINAAGRLDDASVGVRLLLSDDLLEARKLAEALDRANTERQDLQQRISAEAIARAEKLGSVEEHRSVVVSSPGWHVGVVGIVASRLVERFHRPALVLVEEDGLAKGSGRSVEGFHLYDALAACSADLTRFGGHKHAAGLTLALDRLPAFMEAFEAQARAQLTPAQLEPKVRVDARLSIDELDLELALELQRLAPFGAGNPEPVFSCDALTAQDVRILPDKRGLGPGHLKLKVEGASGHRVDAIGFSMGQSVIAPGARLGAAFQLGVDVWSGIEKVQLKLKDVRA